MKSWSNHTNIGFKEEINKIKLFKDKALRDNITYKTGRNVTYKISSLLPTLVWCH